jgi:hypothetical protein
MKLRKFSLQRRKRVKKLRVKKVIQHLPESKSLLVNGERNSLMIQLELRLLDAHHSQRRVVSKNSENSLINTFTFHFLITQPEGSCGITL